MEMSSLDISGLSVRKKKILHKALQLGKKLRNNMIQSIVSNDPFNIEVFDVKHDNSPVSVDALSKTSFSECKFSDLSTEDFGKIYMYLKGDFMTRDDELRTMNLLKSLSSDDLYRVTEKVYCLSHTKYVFSSCKYFNESDGPCNSRRFPVKDILQETIDYNSRVQRITKDCPLNNQTDFYKNELLKYVDSMRIFIDCIQFSDAGIKKMYGSMPDAYLHDTSSTCFVEYKIPLSISKKYLKSVSKVDSGLKRADYAKICSRNFKDSAMHFKYVSIHDICNVKDHRLEDTVIKFILSCRLLKQKQITKLGCAVLNLSCFKYSQNLTCCRELHIKLNENVPIVVGTLRVSIQLGCERIYFGKDFIDAIIHSTENCSDNLSITDSEKLSLQEKCSCTKTKKSQRKIETTATKQKVTGDKKQIETTSNRTVEIQTDKCFHNSNFQILDDEKQLLFGFVYIPEAQLIEKSLNSYFNCKLFGLNDTLQSRLINDTSNPIFNFCQTVPLLYEDHLLETLRENFMVIEIFEKLNTKSILIGITKIPLHQFYIALKNPLIVKYLTKNKLPLIGTDWWEPVSNPIYDKVVGQIQILVAIGTEEQITNLETERGLKKFNVIANANLQSETFTLNNFNNQISNLSSYLNDTKIHHSNNISESGKIFSCKCRDELENSDVIQSSINITDKITSSITKNHIGVQSDFSNMESKPDNVLKVSASQEMLGLFLNQLITQRQKNICIKNSTNTEEPQGDVTGCDVTRDNSEAQCSAQNATNVNLRKTSDLLDSLHKALADDTQNCVEEKTQISSVETFKAYIKIENGLHLPSRKRCKSRKSRNKNDKAEDILPSTYVTFESTAGGKLHMTKIFPKCTSPLWNYECDCKIPVEFLLNEQKRFIFKVWRKSVNTTLEPNMQTDLVLGFTALDLTVLISGLPSIQGWFNVVDFSGKINGVIKICITPQESVTKFQDFKTSKTCNPMLGQDIAKDTSQNIKFDEISEETGELLSRALKRKFTELDEITQRLRFRLSKVTNDETELSNDELVEEFERDINTLCVEDDFNTVNFEEEEKRVSLKQEPNLLCINKSKKQILKMSSHNKATPSVSASMELSDISLDLTEDSVETKIADSKTVNLDNDLLVQGKHRIDTLLLKLSSLQSSEIRNSTLEDEKYHIDNLLEKLNINTDDRSTFSNRHVSGCSVNNDELLNIDTEAILKTLDYSSRPNICSSIGFDPHILQEILQSDSNDASLKSGSNSRRCTRVKLDGQGASTGDKSEVS